MGTIWVKEFTGGLDARRMPETTSGGVLVRAVDGHINRGGEFEKRAAFVPVYRLPAGATKGLAAGKNGLYTFGHESPPTMPSGVSYQRIQAPDGVTALDRVPSYDLYGGLIYVVGEFADGSRYHYYDGVRVPGWFDGRARAAFSVTGGGVYAATNAVGSFEVTGGTLGGGNQITSIQIDGVTITSGAVAHTGNNATTAAAVAANITAHSSSPDYTATANGQTVTVTASATGTAANGKAIVVTVGGTATVGNLVNMAGGADAYSSTIDDVTVDGVSILDAPVTWATSNSDTAEAIAASINTAVSSPDYTATAVGETVNIVAETAGADANGRAVAFTLTGGFAVTPSTGLALAEGTDPTPATAASGSFVVTGGTNNVANKLNTVTIDGVEIMGGAVQHTGSNITTATAIAAAINGYVSTPDYTAAAVDDTVTITAVDEGAAINGKSIDTAVIGDFTVGSMQALSGGTDAEATFIPGTFVKTIGSRMHSVSGPYEHFSGIKTPTKWTTDTTGAGFIDMSTQASGSERLTALAKYQQNVAVIAERVIQIWYFDSDPANNSQKQVLNNTGTASPRSVTQFGDNDLFYLDESGLRSLRARDASNAAATSDIGVPVDPLIQEVLRSMTTEERESVVGLIEPGDGRFWLIMRDVIFVFSFFSGAKISAWSQYYPRTQSGDTVTSFTIEDAAVYRRKLYVRAGDTIYAYGGIGSELEYDDVEAEAWLPYLDANTPTRAKEFTGIDAAVTGTWEVRLAMDPTNLDASDKVATVDRTTYNLGKVDGLGSSTHASLRFKSKGSGAAKVSAAVLHYIGGEDED